MFLVEHKTLLYTPLSFSLSLSISLSVKDNLTALMELNDENQQLITQYEKEKNRRKEFEEVCHALICVPMVTYN